MAVTSDRAAVGVNETADLAQLREESFICLSELENRAARACESTPSQDLEACNCFSKRKDVKCSGASHTY